MLFGFLCAFTNKFHHSRFHLFPFFGLRVARSHDLICRQSISRPYVRDCTVQPMNKQMYNLEKSRHLWHTYQELYRLLKKLCAIYMYVVKSIITGTLHNNVLSLNCGHNTAALLHHLWTVSVHQSFKFCFPFSFYCKSLSVILFMQFGLHHLSVSWNGTVKEIEPRVHLRSLVIFANSNSSSNNTGPCPTDLQFGRPQTYASGSEAHIASRLATSSLNQCFWAHISIAMIFVFAPDLGSTPLGLTHRLVCFTRVFTSFAIHSFGFSGPFETTLAPQLPLKQKRVVFQYGLSFKAKLRLL